MRLPTLGKPRVISCAELLSKHIALPRGRLDDLLILLRNTAISATCGINVSRGGRSGAISR